MRTLIVYLLSLGFAVTAHYVMEDSVFFYVVAVLLGLWNIATAVDEQDRRD